MAINQRKQLAVCLTQERSIGKRLADHKIQQTLVQKDHLAVVHILNSFVSVSQAMVEVLMRLKRVVGFLGSKIKAEWLPSALNRYADGF